jgi:hypothetical protein
MWHASLQGSFDRSADGQPSMTRSGNVSWKHSNFSIDVQLTEVHNCRTAPTLSVQAGGLMAVRILP